MIVQPAFLIIGAMKAGTTTLYRDMSAHPDVFLPQDKEPDVLVKHDRLADMRREYASLFRSAAKGQMTGEASTAYTKRPTHEGVAGKALALCGPDLKLIYIRRDPVKRIVSQYQHERQHGFISLPFDQALRAIPRLVDYSRYDWQVAPWIAAFGAGNVLQLDLEHYSRDRLDTLDRVCTFLGLDASRMRRIDKQAAYNRGDEQKKIENPVLRAIILSRFYQRGLKNLVPRGLRDRGRKVLLRPPRIEAVHATDEDRAYISKMLAEPRP
jgi:hypothetical protein